MQSFLHPDVREVDAVNTQFGGKPKTPKKTKKQPKLPKSQISVLVLNAGTVAGQASNTSYQLTTRGYTTKALPAGDQANAPKVQRDTTVYYDPVQANAQQAAQQLRPLFGSHTRVAQMTTDISDLASRAGNPLTVVTVGTSFGGKLVIHKPPKVQPKKPPQVSNGAAMTAPRLRGVYDEVHFPLMVPHKIAAGIGSSRTGRRPRLQAAQEPARGRAHVRVPGDAPSTGRSRRAPGTPPRSSRSRPSRSSTAARSTWSTRRGGAIQMVALRTPRATYWVSNTILNELSNSTMVAIAESLRPLRR